MIYTVTFNPSLDYIIGVDGFETGKVNRTSEEVIFPGGKGINVSIVLHNLGLESTAIGFIAGFTGQEIQRRIGTFGIDNQFIQVEQGISRVNVKLRNLSENAEGEKKVVEETEINGQGPMISSRNWRHFISSLTHLQKRMCLFLQEVFHRFCRQPFIVTLWQS